jgi:hypothetical protein
MKGSPEEEIGIGSLDKYKMLRKIHDDLSPDLYLEIGVQKGRSLDLARCKSIGVDPNPRTIAKPNQTIYPITSDEFFAMKLNLCPDFIFIDGLHLFEQALRDFSNCEKISHTNTTIIIDDIFPAHPAQALRERRTQKWTGDVWKVLAILKKYREDLSLRTLDVFPTGLLLIRNLDQSNTILSDHYDSIISEYLNIDTVPQSILDRSYA